MSSDNPIPDNSPPLLSNGKPVQILEEGKPVTYTKAYGVGIDCHSKFIAVTVLLKVNDETFQYQKMFQTDWSSLVESRDWVVNLLATVAIPPVLISDECPLHYVIESTSSYHAPILLAWGGIASVINPMLAGFTSRKTDRLDSYKLSIQDISGLWKDFYQPTQELLELRVMIKQKFYFNQSATRISNRINNNLLKFGYTLGRDGSVTKNKTIRAAVEDQLSDHPTNAYENLSPYGLPQNVKVILRNDYLQYDNFMAQVRQYEDMIYQKVISMKWETDKGMVSGKELINVLTTVPGVGIQTACLWLAVIATPKRFPDKKAIAAYCGLDPSVQVSAGHVTSIVRRGGNKDIHKALCMGASVLLSKHSEPFGKWGYNIYIQSNRWKKGTNAVARKMCTALHYVHSNVVPFSYESYKVVMEKTVLPIPFIVMCELNKSFTRYKKALDSAGLTDMQLIVNAYYNFTLRKVKGIGSNFYVLLRDFIDNTDTYYKKYEEYLKTNENTTSICTSISDDRNDH